MTASFDFVVHSDWGVVPASRWSALAVCEGSGWTVLHLEPSGDLTARLNALSTKGRVLAGFDFPIGVPASYGALTGLNGFEDLLDLIGTGDWDRWPEVCRTAEEISVHRPFYPHAGGAKGTVAKCHLEEGLTLALPELRRECERDGGEILFWTLGPKSVGKGAIHGLTQTIRPLCANGARLWPFHGTLEGLAEARLVLAETYPARSYATVCGTKLVGKGDASALKNLAPAILATCARLRATLPESITARLQEGFASGSGDGKANSDEFDALIGLLGMIEAIGRPDVTRRDFAPQVQRWEGWMLNALP